MSGHYVRILFRFRFRFIMLRIPSLICVMMLVTAGMAEAEGSRVLVLLENLTVKETHSIYFKSLMDAGFDLTYKVADDSGLQIKKYGQYLYEHIIVFAPSVEEFGGDLSAEAITEFIDDGGNILIAANSNVGEVLREVASEVGFEIDEDGTAVIDHLNYDAKDQGKHTLVVADPKNLIKSDKIVGKASAPMLYRGVGLLVDQENPLVMEILTGSSTSYSHNPDTMIKEFPHAVGKQTVMIAGLQARNNARVVFSGSFEFFSDEFFSAKVEPVTGAAVQSGNKALALALSKWCFKQSGVLKVESIAHHKKGEKNAPSHYTIKEEAVYNIVVKELVDGKWVGFNGKDMQMEFVRIDPFVRITMENKGQGKMEGNFKVPDTYGVYQFKVNYHRVGYTRVYETTQVICNFLSNFIISSFPLDLCCATAPQRVRALHRVGLSLLRKRLQHDGRSLRVLIRLPPLQRGGGQEEDRVIM